MSTNDTKTQITESVCYIYDDNLIKICDILPKAPKRASVVHSLIQAYGLLKDLRLIPAKPATQKELLTFHTQEYIDCLKALSEQDDFEKCEEEGEAFGLTYDCPVFPGAHDYAQYVAGGSITAARCLTNGHAMTAIHWTGGWHHANRDEASGFCYYNDIVLAILELRKKFNKVLYVDIDLHHGDGVENAFCVTPKVLTVSFHKYSPGFFPGTGRMDEIGLGKGKHHAINVPLKDGVQDLQFIDVFQKIMQAVLDTFEPQVIVCQCGADGLVTDPMNSFNLTPESHVSCVKYLLKSHLPTLLLGGGGYNIADTARCWTQITAAVLGRELGEDIPEHTYFPLYGPHYELAISPGNRSNRNSAEYLNDVVQQTMNTIKCIKDLEPSS